MLQTIPLAYKFVMSSLIVAFINHYASRMNMPFSTPLNAEQQAEHVGIQPPQCDAIVTLYGGGYREKNYSFGFGFGECTNIFAPFTAYFSITKLEDDGMASFGIPLLYPHESSNSLMERASRMKYKIEDTNTLYFIATNYLNALEIDIKKLEAKHPHGIDKGPFHSNRGLVASPLVLIYWGKRDVRDPGADGIAMEFSAVSGELLELGVGTSTGCQLPLIKNLDKLLAISDEEFLKMSDAEHTTLLYRFANNNLFPPPQTATNQVQLNLTTNRIVTTNSPK